MLEDAAHPQERHLKRFWSGEKESFHPFWYSSMKTSRENSSMPTLIRALPLWMLYQIFTSKRANFCCVGYFINIPFCLWLLFCSMCIANLNIKYLYVSEHISVVLATPSVRSIFHFVRGYFFVWSRSKAVLTDELVRTHEYTHTKSLSHKSMLKQVRVHSL